MKCERIDDLGQVFAGNAEPLSVAEPDADEDRVELRPGRRA